MTALKAPVKLVRYEDDVLLWSLEQAQALRERRFADLDIEHLADEIEDVGKTEKRELASRYAVFLGHLLKWTLQSTPRTRSWELTIRDQRRRIARALKAAPSLRAVMREDDWRADAWQDARTLAERETGVPYADLPDASPWTVEQACDPDFWPD